MASDEKPIVEMFRVKDGEDLEFIEYIGSPDYIQKQTEKQMSLLKIRKENKQLEGISNELRELNRFYSERIKEYESNAPKFHNSNFLSLYMSRYNRHLLDSLSPTLNRIKNIKLVKEVMSGKDVSNGNFIRNTLNEFKELNQKYSLENINKNEEKIDLFLRKGKKVCEDMNIDPKLITDEEIEKYYDGIGVIVSDISFLMDNSAENSYSHKNKLEALLKEKRYSLKREKDATEIYNQDLIDKLEDEISRLEGEISDLVALDGCSIKSSYVDEWVKYLNMKVVSQIKSPDDITFRDFVLYVAPRSLEKPKKNKWPSEEKMIDAMNAARRIIPECIPLSRISRNVALNNGEGSANNVRKQPLSDLDEKKLNKLWKEYTKHYNILSSK